jgi:hypothetical protein
MLHGGRGPALARAVGIHSFGKGSRDHLDAQEFTGRLPAAALNDHVIEEIDRYFLAVLLDILCERLNPLQIRWQQFR